MTVSVIIPCYNAEPYVAQTIGSVLEQTRSPDELIVVDDGSTDGSVDVARRFGDRVRLLTGRNGGASPTRLKGLAHARGDALMFLDADDVLGPTVLEALEDELGRHPGSIAACTWYRLEREHGVWMKRPPSCRPRKSGQDPLDAWLRGWYHPPCAVLWSREAYERSGGWDERAGPNDDGFLMMRALVQDVPLRLTEAGEAFYRRLPGDAVSFSGTRFTEEGIRARMWAIGRIAEMLEVRGRLSLYHGALEVAFGVIESDARDEHPGLAAEARRHRYQYGLSLWKRAARRLGHRVRKRLRDAGSARAVASEAGPVSEPEEIRFGLDLTDAPSSSRA